MLASAIPGPVIRPASRHELPKLAALIGKPPNWVRQAAADLRHQRRCILIAEEEQTLVGLLDVQSRALGSRRRLAVNILRRLFGVPRPTRDSILQPMTYATVRDVVVSEPSRREEIIRTLVKKSLIELRDQGILELYKTVDAVDQQQIPFWRELGFEPCRYVLRLRRREVNRRAKDLQETGGCVIRPASGRDLGQLSELVRREVAAQLSLSRGPRIHNRVDWYQYTASKLNRHATALMVADSAGSLAGYVEVRLLESRVRIWRRRAKKWLGWLDVKGGGPVRSGVIEDVYVLPQWRREGLASALIACGIQWIGGNVLGSIWHGNEGSLKLFQEMGFSTYEVQLSKRFGTLNRDQEKTGGYVPKTLRSTHLGNETSCFGDEKSSFSPSREKARMRGHREEKRIRAAGQRAQSADTNAPTGNVQDGEPTGNAAVIFERAPGDSQLAGTVREETVILSVKDGVYYSLSGVGSRVWDLLQQPRSIDELVDQLTAEYAVEREQCWHDVHRLLEDMSNSGLVAVHVEEQVP